MVQLIYYKLKFIQWVVAYGLFLSLLYTVSTYYMGLPGTDGPCIGEKSYFPIFLKQGSDQNKNIFWLIGLWKWKYQHPYEDIIV